MSPLRVHPSEPHRIMTSTARARTEPASSGFMRSVMRHHRMDDFGCQREKKYTQEEQDEEDEEARKQAMKNLVNSWQERLQLISVISTFFATTEAAIMVNTKPSGSSDWENTTLQVSNATLLGALIVHVYASVLSFLAAFLIISYKLREARREEMIAEGITMADSPLGGSVPKDVEQCPIDRGLQQTFMSSDAQSIMHRSVNNGTATSVPDRNMNNGLYPVEPPIIFSADPHIEQVGPFKPNVSSHLLSRTHALCVFLTAVGFMFAIIGILCYSWALQPRAVSIFASTCLGGAVLTTFALGI